MGLNTLPVGKNEFYDGTNWYQLASEPWVLNKIGAISSCKVATTTTLTATYVVGTAGVGATLTNTTTPQAALTIDGQTLSVGDRILVKDQSNNIQNGLYTLTTVGSTTTNWVLTRVIDFDSSSQMILGSVIQVIFGIANAVTSWMLTSPVTTVGTSPITFAKMGGATTAVNGTTNQIVVTNASGTATISLPPGALALPTGTRPTTPIAGMMRWTTSI